MRGTPGCSATKSICAKNMASSAAIGESAPAAALSTRASRRTATQSITDSKIASLVGKWRNKAPWVKPIRCAIAVVVMSLGFCSAANSTTASTVAARRSSAGKCLGSGCIGVAQKKVIDYHLTTRHLSTGESSKFEENQGNRLSSPPIGGALLEA